MKNTVVDYRDILQYATQAEWLACALDNINLLLVDHAHCERKAAQNAMSLIFKYPDHERIITQLSKIVREEMVHFEQVLRFLKKRKVSFKGLKSGGYAAFLGQFVREDHPINRFVDQLLIAAIIEARSSERLGLLAPLLPQELGQYYQRLHDAEARHCSLFIEMAQSCSDQNVEERLLFFAQHEACWLSTPDDCFRFHSGLPLGKHATTGSQ